MQQEEKNRLFEKIEHFGVIALLSALVLALIFLR